MLDCQCRLVGDPAPAAEPGMATLCGNPAGPSGRCCCCGDSGKPPAAWLSLPGIAPASGTPFSPDAPDCTPLCSPPPRFSARGVSAPPPSASHPPPAGAATEPLATEPLAPEEGGERGERCSCAVAAAATGERSPPEALSAGPPPDIPIADHAAEPPAAPGRSLRLGWSGFSPFARVCTSCEEQNTKRGFST